MGTRSRTGHTDTGQQEECGSNSSEAKKAKMSGQGGQGQWRQGHGGGRGRGGGGGYGSGYGRGRGGGYRGQGSSGSGGGRRRDQLVVGMRGFLCSCNYNERDCVKEAYNILNEYFREDEDHIKSDKPEEPSEAEGNVQVSSPDDTEIKPAEDDEEEDIEKALQAEVKQLKSTENKFKFKSVDTEVTNLVFISTTVEDPAKLAHRILEDLNAKKEQKSKFLLRMLPIDYICKAYMDDLEKTFREIVPQHFPAGEYTSFQIIFKSRYNGNIHRDDVIKLLADIVVEVNSLSVVDLTNPKCTILVEVIKNKICLGFLKDFALYKKYNLVEVATPPAPKEDPVTAATTTEEVAEAAVKSAPDQPTA